MAYYNSSYYQGSNDLGEYHKITSYGGDYFSNDSLDSVNYSSSCNKDPSIYNLFDYDPTPYHHAYNNQYSAYDHHQHLNRGWSSTSSYSQFTPTKSKSVVYEPNSYHMMSYDQNPQTRFVISYSVSDQFNVPEFDDYDPTPYCGGYDIAQTYGKPLPPSDQTCYPRSTAPGMIIPKVPSLEDHHKDKEKEKIKAHEEEIKIKDEESKLPKEAAKEEEEKKKGQEEKDTNKERISTEEVNYDYGNNNQVMSQIPSGYGLEAMDLCESIFGYWPCLARYARKANYNGNCHDQQGGCCNNGYYYSNYHNWNGAADYLFGSSDPYVEKRDGGGSFGMPIHCYQRRSQEPPLTRQLEYTEHDHQVESYYSWSQNFK